MDHFHPLIGGGRTEDFGITQRRVGVLAHDGFGASALTTDQRIEDRLLLHMGIVEATVFTDHVFAINRQRRH